MFDGFRSGAIQLGVILGIALVLFPATWWATSHTHSPISTGNQNPNQLHQQEQNPRGVINSTRSNPVTNPESPNHPAHPKYYEHQDLDAQESMAESTEAIVL